MKVLFISSEVSPFAKTGGLGDVAEALPLALNEIKVDCSVIMPFYKLVWDNGFFPSLFRSGIPLKMGANVSTFDIYFIKYKNTKFYFIKSDDLYNRDGLYGTPKGDHGDNALRFGFFSRAVLESLPFIGEPDILHCNDWQSGLIPFYLKHSYEKRLDPKKIKVLFTIHNMAYQGLFKPDVMDELDLPKEFFTMEGYEFYGKLSLIKSGIVYSDAISTVSEGYAKEIVTEEFGCGLDGILRTRQNDLYGIVNGADYSTWDPKTDRFITKNYTKETIGLKLESKKDLAKEFDIEFDESKPVIGMITRLAEQKGVDLVVSGMERLLSMGVNFVILGTGDERYNSLFKDFSGKYKGRAGAMVAFNNPIAHKIEAGCDMFLMPSRYEPCGLNQMYSLKYGTIPVVRDTGGLRDTIEDYDAAAKKGNGFKFSSPNTEEMLKAVKRAVDIFKDKPAWKALQLNALKYDLSWNRSAKKYAELYKAIKSKSK